MTNPDYRPGDWFFLGAICAALITKYFEFSPVWLMAACLFIGWAINEAMGVRHDS